MVQVVQIEMFDQISYLRSVPGLVRIGCVQLVLRFQALHHIRLCLGPSLLALLVFISPFLC